MLVPEDIIFGLLSKRLEAGYFRGETGFILEGIPRTRKQAVSFFVYIVYFLDLNVLRSVGNFLCMEMLGK